MMKRPLRLVSILFLAAFLLACEGDTLPFNLPPTLTVSEATDIYRKGATISGSYTKANDKVGVETFGLYYATNSLLGDADSILATPEELQAGNYTITLNNLTPATTYYYATFASSGFSIAKSDIKQFRTLDTTEPKLGEVTTSNITRTSFNVSSSILDDGGSDITIRGFLVREAPTDISSLGFEDRQIRVENDADFNTIISDLTPGTRYAVCAYAMTAKAYGFSEIRYVTTANLNVPIVSAITATTTSAAHELQVSASVVDEGTSSVTERGFVYSLDMREPTIENPKVVAQGNNESFSATLKNLPSDQTVYIRAYAKSNDGIGYGDVFTYNESDKIQQPTVSFISAYTTEVANTLYVTASITKEGTYAVIERGFAYSTDTQTPTVESNRKVQATGTNQSFTASIGDLIQSQTNYIRAYVRTSVGYSYGTSFSYNASDFPTLTTQAATNVMPYSADILAELDAKSSQIRECGFMWSDSNPNPLYGNEKLVLSVGASLNGTLTGLKDNTIYYYRPFANHSKGVSYGTVKQFRTLLVQQAELSVAVISGISYREANFKASVTNLNNGTLTDAGFVYSTLNNPTLTDSHISTGTGTTLSAVCSSLQPNTKYYVRAYATNEKGTAYGPEATFTTNPIELAELSATTVTDVSYKVATFTASITATYNHPITDAGFVYSKSNNPTHADFHISTGTGTSLSAVCRSLQTGTTYYVRAYATNEGGTAYGSVSTFKTYSENNNYIERDTFDDDIIIE